jgi:hypothetical protein
MTDTEFWGLVALGGCFGTIGAWLQVQRTIPARRRNKWAEFCVCLAMCAYFISLFGLQFLRPSPVPPSPPQVIFMSLSFLACLGFAVSEIRVAFRARNANYQRAPVDSDS